MSNYLYNGLPLPELPDGVAYAAIGYDPTPIYKGIACLFVMSDMEKLRSNGFLYNDNAEVWYLANGVWVLNDDQSGILSISVMWANYDILNSDDTLYLSATTPISLANQTVIEWDGNTEGLESTTYNGLTYYKVAEVAPSKAQTNGGYHVINSVGVRITSENPKGTGWLVKDGAVWFYSNGTDYTSLFTYLTVAPVTDRMAHIRKAVMYGVLMSR